MSTGYEDSFYVMVDGAPKMMTLDELVEAYEADVINGGTLVVEVGGSDWRPLSEVADLGDDDDASQAAPEEESPASVNFAPAQERRPAISNPPPVGSAPERRPAITNAPPVGAVTGTRPAISNPPPVGSMHPGTAPRSQAPISVAPSSLAPVSHAPLSTAPFVQDLDFGDDLAFRKGRSKAPIFVALAVLAVGGGAFAVTQSGSAPASIPAPVVAAPSPVAAPTVATQAAAPVAPAKEATPSDDAADSATKGEGRLTDAMKEALLARDKERSVSKKATGGARARTARSSKASKSSSDGVFRAGGSADDPLNSKL